MVVQRAVVPPASGEVPDSNLPRAAAGYQQLSLSGQSQSALTFAKHVNDVPSASVPDPNNLRKAACAQGTYGPRSRGTEAGEEEEEGTVRGVLRSLARHGVEAEQAPHVMGNDGGMRLDPMEGMKEGTAAWLHRLEGGRIRERYQKVERTKLMKLTGLTRQEGTKGRDQLSTP